MMGRRPARARDRRRGQRGPGWVRAIVGAILLAATGLLTWLGLRRRARASPEESEQQRRAAQLARLRRLGHEPNTANVGAIIGIAVALVVLTAILSVGLWGLYNAFAARPTPQTASAPLNAPLQRPGTLPTPTIPPLPARLPVGPADQQQKQTQDEAVLNSYGWVDRDKGIVRIPIDRAIDLVIERGLPTREGR
jgi:hypothetical protein